jgi:hypothetical protein
MWVLFGIMWMTTTAEMQPPSWTYRLEWEHDGQAVTHFELCLDTGCRTLDATRTQGARTWSAPLPILTEGFHTLLVYACNNATCVQGVPSVAVNVLPGPVVASPNTPPPPQTPTPGPPTQKAPPRRPPKKT